MTFSRSSLVCLALALAASGCEPRELDYRVTVLTTACQAPAPLEGVTHLRLRVTGEGLDTPLEVTSSVSPVERVLRVPQIPAGVARRIEVRAYAGEPTEGGKVVSLGRSLPFDVPDTPPERREPIEISVFLRRVNQFTPPNSIAEPGRCSQMLSARAGHTATLLPNGKVFIAGGYQQPAADKARKALYVAELFNPSTGGFEPAPDIGFINSQQLLTPLARAFHTATLLNDRRVLLWGGEEYGTGDVNGSNPSLRASVLLFNPETNIFDGVPFTNLANVGRSHHGAALDSGGRVLIVGGLTRTSGVSGPIVAEKVEWFDPVTTIGKLLEVSLPRSEMSVLPVQAGKYIAVAGGSDGTKLVDEVALFGFDGAGFSQVRPAKPPKLKESRRAAAVVGVRETNELLVMGGFTEVKASRPASSSELISTHDPYPVAPGPPVSARGELCTVVLPDKRVISIGGRTADLPEMVSRSDGTVELVTLQPSGPGAMAKGPDLDVPRYHHTCTVLEDGSVLVLGGVREGGGRFEILQDAMLYTPEPLEP